MIKLRRLLLAVIFMVIFVSIGFSDEADRSATVTQVTGEVMVKNRGPGSWFSATPGCIVREGAFIKTGPGAKAVLGIDDSKTALVNVNEKSLVSLDVLKKDNTTGAKKTLLGLSLGQILIKAGKLETPDSKFEVKTPTSTVGVRGTKFSVKVDAVK